MRPRRTSGSRVVSVTSRLPDLIGRLRGLFRHPGYLAMASLTLALGVAAMVSAFVPVNGLLLRPPPFPNHEHVAFYGRGAEYRSISPRLYNLLATPEGVRSTGVARVSEAINVSVGEHILLLRGQRVNMGFLPTLGVMPEIGHPFSGDTDETMVSWDFWRTWLEADAHAIGSTILINGRPFHVRGVLPPSYRLFEDVDVLLPLGNEGDVADHASNLMAVAWLAPGTSIDSFARQVNQVATRHAGELGIPKDQLGGYGATSLAAQVTASSRPTLLLFLGCGALVLLIAGLNLSSLMLVRAMAKSREVELQVALGARGYRLWLPLAAEATLIGTLAVTMGLQLGGFLAHMFTRFLPGAWFAPDALVRIDWRVRLFAVVVAMIVLAIATSGRPLYRRPEGISRRHHDGAPRSGAVVVHARRIVGTAQTALATILLVLSVGMIVRWWNLDQVPLGFRADQALLFEVSPDEVQYPSLNDVVTLADRLRHHLGALPGIDSVGLSNHLPITGRFIMPFKATDGRVQHIQYAVITPGAMEAMGMEILRGRQLEEGDTPDTLPVALVNEAYLRAFGSDDVVRPALPGDTIDPLHIVGVVADTRHAGPDRDPEPTVFLPLAQVPPSTFTFARRFMAMHVIMRGPGALTLDATTIASVVHSVAPALAVSDVRALQSDINAVLDPSRRDAVLSTAFAMVAVILACIGLYSSQSVDVAMRRGEFAMMGAMGATPGDLLGRVLSRGCGPAFAGVAIGLAIAAWLSGRGWMDRLTSWKIVDTTVVTFVSLVMVLLTLAACGIPAMRAARIDPLHVIR